MDVSIIGLGQPERERCVKLALVSSLGERLGITWDTVQTY